MTDVPPPTERLIFRHYTLDDVDALLPMFSDAETMRFYGGVHDRDATRAWLEKATTRDETDGHSVWALELKETGEFVGHCGLLVQEVDEVRENEIGYFLNRAYWGRGLITEAAIATREFGFDHFGYVRLISIIDPENVGSIRVAEKNGMTLERNTRWCDMDICVYSLERA